MKFEGEILISFVYSHIIFSSRFQNFDQDMGRFMFGLRQNDQGKQCPLQELHMKPNDIQGNPKSSFLGISPIN